MASFLDQNPLQKLGLLMSGIASTTSRDPRYLQTNLAMQDSFQEMKDRERMEAEREKQDLLLRRLANPSSQDMIGTPATKQFEVNGRMVGQNAPGTMAPVMPDDMRLRSLTRAFPRESLVAELEKRFAPETVTVSKPGDIGRRADGSIAFENPAAPKEPKLETIFDAQGREIKAILQPDGSYKPVGGAKAQAESLESWALLTPDQALARGLPKGGTYESSSRGQTRAVVNPTKEMGPAAMKVAQAEVGAAGVLYGLDKFEAAIREAPEGAQMEAFFGGLTPAGQKINTAWTNAALLAKGEELYNLGVLSGPDLDIIQKALPDPSTKGGAIKNKDTYYTAINEVRDLLNKRLDASRKAYGDGTSPQAAPVASDRPKDAPAEARKAKNGKWYAPDPLRPGKYVEY